MSKWLYPINIPFAESGDKMSIPDVSTDGTINNTVGFGSRYGQDPAIGGLYIQRSNMNDLFFKSQVSIKELQEKTILAINNVIPDANGNVVFNFDNLLNKPTLGKLSELDEVPNASITTAKLADRSVSASKIGDSAVVTSKLSDSAVSTSKILNGAVTNTKLAQNSIATTNILNKNVTTDKLADKSVTSDKLADFAITYTKIANGVVDTDKLAYGAVTSDKIAGGAITGNKLANGAIDSSKLSFNVPKQFGFSSINVNIYSFNILEYFTGFVNVYSNSSNTSNMLTARVNLANTASGGLIKSKNAYALSKRYNISFENNKSACFCTLYSDSTTFSASGMEPIFIFVLMSVWSYPTNFPNNAYTGVAGVTVYSTNTSIQDAYIDFIANAMSLPKSIVENVLDQGVDITIYLRNIIKLEAFSGSVKDMPIPGATGAIFLNKNSNTVIQFNFPGYSYNRSLTNFLGFKVHEIEINLIYNI